MKSDKQKLSLIHIYAEQDVKARMLAEQKVEAARVLESLHGALAADAALLSACRLYTSAASYQAYNRCWSGRPDKAFTPHPASFLTPIERNRPRPGNCLLYTSR